MDQFNFEKWMEVAKKIQEPFHAIAELNLKTIQGLAYVKYDEVAQVKTPVDVLEKQVGVVVENSHKALNYMQKTLHIIEKAVQGIVHETKK